MCGVESEGERCGVPGGARCAMRGEAAWGVGLGDLKLRGAYFQVCGGHLKISLQFADTCSTLCIGGCFDLTLF